MTCLKPVKPKRVTPSGTWYKRIAIAGLTVGILLWQVGFIAIGGEWFGMWMSPQWNGIPSAFRYLVITLGALIFLSLPDHDTSEP